MSCKFFSLNILFALACPSQWREGKVMDPFCGSSSPQCPLQLPLSFLLHLLWFFWLILGWGQKKGNGTRTKCDILLLWYPNYHALFPGAKSGGLAQLFRDPQKLPWNLLLLAHWPWHVFTYKEVNMNFHSNHKLVFVCSVNYRQLEWIFLQWNRN